MNEVVIPEVVERSVFRDNNEEKKYNLKLSQNIDKRNYNVNNSWTTNNTTVTNNTTQINKGFFGFLLELVLLPFKIPYQLITYVFKKYDLKNKWNLEMIEIKKDKWRRKYLKTSKSIYDLDEVY